MGRASEDEYRFSNSELQTFKECRRKWYLQYYKRWRRKTRDVRVARETGIIVHGALHEYYKNDHDEDAATDWLRDCRERDLQIVEAYNKDALVDAYKFAGVVVDGYFDWLSETGADQNIRVTGSEQTLEAPGPVEGTTLFGIIDLLGSHTVDNDIVVLDTKVVQSIPETIRMLHLNEQALMYALLAKVNDPDPDRRFRVVWSMLKRSKRTAKAEGPFYDRYDLVISPGQLEVFYQQLKGVIEQILSLESALNGGMVNPNEVAYPTPTKDCAWKCEYFQICPGMNDPNTDTDWALNQYYEVSVRRPVVVEIQADSS